MTITTGDNAVTVEPPSGLGLGRSRRPVAATVALLSAVAAVSLAAPSRMWTPYLREVLERQNLSTLGLVGMLQVPLLFVWAALSDAGASRGIRRERFVLVGAFLAAAGWAIAPFVGTAMTSLLLVTFLLQVGFSFAHVALDGVLVARARSRAATGRLSAGGAGAKELSTLALFPLAALLADRTLGWTASVGALAALAAGVALIVPFAREAPLASAGADPPIARERFLHFLRSGRFWSLTLVGTLAAPGGTPTLYLSAKNVPLPVLSFEEQRKAELIFGLAALAATGAYAIVCRRVRLRTLLPICLLARAAGSLAFLARSGGGGPSLDVATALGGAGLTLGTIAVLDLTMRTVPRGHEALGYLISTGLPLLIGPPLCISLAYAAGLGFATTVTLSAGAVALGAFASYLVPKALTSAPDAPRT